MISYKKLFLLMEEQEITKEKLKNKIGISSAKMKMFQSQQFKVFAIFLTASPVLFCHMKKKLIKILLFSDFVKKWK